MSHLEERFHKMQQDLVAIYANNLILILSVWYLWSCSFSFLVLFLMLMLVLILMVMRWLDILCKLEQNITGAIIFCATFEHFTGACKSAQNVTVEHFVLQLVQVGTDSPLPAALAHLASVSNDDEEHHHHFRVKHDDDDDYDNSMMMMVIWW